MTDLDRVAMLRLAITQLRRETRSAEVRQRRRLKQLAEYEQEIRVLLEGRTAR